MKIIKITLKNALQMLPDKIDVYQLICRKFLQKNSKIAYSMGSQSNKKFYM
jgi:hypothetical protein